MKKYVFTLLGLLLSISCFSERNLFSLVDSLRKNGVDSIIVLKVVEGGVWGTERLNNDTCSPTGYYKGVYVNNYVVWKRSGKCYFTKTHPCINYKPMLVDCSSLFLFINKNASRMRKEKIYPEGYGSNSVTWHENNVNTQVYIYLKSKVIHFKFNQTDIEKEYNPKYFNYNLQLRKMKFTNKLIRKLKTIAIGNEHKFGL
nr:hypothetical protein [uncultured Bacteroides sp.]